MIFLTQMHVIRGDKCSDANNVAAMFNATIET